MKRNSSWIFLSTLILFLGTMACKKSSETNSNTPVGDSAVAAPSARSASGTSTGTDSYPSIEMAAMRDLWENSDAVDIIFYETNFSLSQNDKAAIQNTLGYFLPSPIAHNPNCKPIGRLTFMVKGEIRREADIYTAEGCQYFLWMENGKPVYINPMSQQGVTFFNEILKKGQGAFQ